MGELTIRQLRAVIALAEELSFGRAAERLHITQPPFTRLIQSAEKTLGVQLFHRTTRSVSMTPAGRVFIEDARSIIDQLTRAQERARQTHSGDQPRVSIGATEAAAYTIMPNTLARFRMAFPEREVECIDLHTSEQLRRLRERELTWAVVRAPVTEPDVEAAIVYKEELVIAAPAARRLSAVEDFSFFADDVFVAYDKPLGIGILSATVAAAADAGFVPEVGHHAASTAMLLSIVATGAAVGVVSRSVAGLARSGVQFVRLRGRPLHATVMVLWRKGEREPTLDAFLHILGEEGERVWDDP